MSVLKVQQLLIIITSFKAHAREQETSKLQLINILARSSLLAREKDLEGLGSKAFRVMSDL